MRLGYGKRHDAEMVPVRTLDSSVRCVVLSLTVDPCRDKIVDLLGFVVRTHDMLEKVRAIRTLVMSKMLGD